MKWLLILFLGVIVVPVFAQNAPINQTEYQKLTNSINGIQIDSKKISSSINETRNELQNDYQNMYNNINESRVESKNYYLWSLGASGGVAIVAFLGSVIVAVIIAKRQDIQTTRITEMTLEVQNVTKKQNKLIEDTKAVYAQQYVSWVQLIVKNFESVVDWYNTRYLDQPISQTREDTRKNLIDYYERDLMYWCPKIEGMELVKIFGKEIAYEVLSHTTSMHATDWLPNTDYGMSMMINEYKERIKQAIDLKDTFLPYGDENMKVKDQKLKETYDKIKATP
ncbi:MAG: hypothetical protein ACREBA_02000 [Nitrosotalea sp.]